MIPSGKWLARDLITYMVGLWGEDTQELVERYRISQGTDLDNSSVKLPKKVL
jgi:hypothetical protein